MNPAIGWSELVVIGLIAIVVVGPKDLPLLMRKLGQFMTRARNAASEFQASLDELGRQAELDSLRTEAMKAQRAINDATWSVSSAIEDPSRTNYGADLFGSGKDEAAIPTSDAQTLAGDAAGDAAGAAATDGSDASPEIVASPAGDPDLIPDMPEPASQVKEIRS